MPGLEKESMNVSKFGRVRKKSSKLANFESQLPSKNQITSKTKESSILNFYEPLLEDKSEAICKICFKKISLGSFKQTLNRLFTHTKTKHYSEWKKLSVTYGPLKKFNNSKTKKPAKFENSKTKTPAPKIVKDNTHTCHQCHKTFSRITNMQRHIKLAVFSPKHQENALFCFDCYSEGDVSIKKLNSN